MKEIPDGSGLGSHARNKKMHRQALCSPSVFIEPLPGAGHQISNHRQNPQYMVIAVTFRHMMK